MAQDRRRRANGEVSRILTLEAATEIAGERGYEGTSINLVSEMSGLPASSIYWHFANKDELVAAVIETSFERWLHELDAPWAPPEGLDRDEAFRAGLERSGRMIAEFPHFLRLGLMLILERRPNEPTARAKFLEVRAVTADRVTRFYSRTFPDLPAQDCSSLAALTLALSDGFFIAAEVDEIDLGAAFDLSAGAILATARAFATPKA